MLWYVLVEKPVIYIYASHEIPRAKMHFRQDTNLNLFFVLNGNYVDIVKILLLKYAWVFFYEDTNYR